MRFASFLFIGAVALSSAESAESADPRDPTVKGFVATRFVTALYEGKTGKTAAWDKSDGLPECPDGFAVGPDKAAFLAKLPAAEREQLQLPENREDFWDRLMYRGPNGINVCTHPQSVPDPGFRTVQGKLAYGLDLDGSDGSSTPIYNCPHENFTGPNGERGIDNQMYRIVGCLRGRRQGSQMYDYFNGSMRQGDFTILIELTGVDDTKNDDEVRVAFYAGQDPMVNNVNDVSLSHASLRVHYDRHYHAFTRGKIVDGVLTTEPVEVLFKSSFEMRPYHIRDARLRVTIQPDGSFKGILGGYENITTIYADLTHNGPYAENDHEGPMTCPGLYYALQRLADGYPDSLGSKQCKWMSSAYEIEAMPAFVIHPKEDEKVACVGCNP